MTTKRTTNSPVEQKSMTVGELIEALKKFPVESGFHGWDDGAIIITQGDTALGSVDPGYYRVSDKGVELY